MASSYKSYLQLLLFFLLVAGIAATGVQFRPGEWYMLLNKPFWTPPSWLFPPVWTILYVMIAIAGWLIYRGNDFRLKLLWATQLVLNGLWSWLFFGLHRTDLGLIDILALLITIAAAVTLARKSNRTSAWLMLPYLIWVGYASTLNAAIFVMNP